MNSVFATLLKNFLLLALVADNLIFIFTNFIGYKEEKFHLTVLGLLFIAATCFEAYKLSAVKNDTHKFTYFTDGFLSKRIIKIIVFICAGFVLYYSGSIIRYMAFLCFIIAITELVVTVWRYLKKLCFIAFEEDRFLICTNTVNVMRAIHIAKIEARHGLLYLVDTNNKTFTIRTDMMKDKERFMEFLDIWIEANNLKDKVVEL